VHLRVHQNVHPHRQPDVQCSTFSSRILQPPPLTGPHLDKLRPSYRHPSLRNLTAGNQRIRRASQRDPKPPLKLWSPSNQRKTANQSAQRHWLSQICHPVVARGSVSFSCRLPLHPLIVESRKMGTEPPHQTASGICISAWTQLGSFRTNYGSLCDGTG
jgi:hypothetical protein